jgi:hypothetical protein
LAAEALWPEKYLRNPKAKAKSADIKWHQLREFVHCTEKKNDGN